MADTRIDPRVHLAEAVSPSGGFAASTVSASPGSGVKATGDPWIDCQSRTQWPTLYNPNLQPVPGENRRFYKQSFVDPICITITSTTLNVRWKNALNSSNSVTILEGTRVNPFYYRDLGEEWPASRRGFTTIPGPATSQTAGNVVMARSNHTRVETRFPENIAQLGASVFGLTGWALVYAVCGRDLGDTTFKSSQNIGLQRNARWFATGSGSVTGGCSNLVHERTWHAQTYQDGLSYGYSYGPYAR